MDKLSYALGLGIGQQLKQMGLKDVLKVEDFSQSIIDVLADADLKVSHAEGQKIVNDFFQKLEDVKRAEAAEAGKAAKADGEKFLAENAKKAGVITTASGLIDGTVFDSSYQRNEPADFGLQQVIAGWTEGVQLMAEGAKYRFYIPYMLAYGEGGAGALIPPFSALIFDVELIKVL